MGRFAILETKDLSFSYNEHLVFENLNFTLQPGQILGLMGKNGAGKSTLIQCLLKQLQPQGEIHWDSSILSKNEKINFEQVFWLNDNPHYYPYLTGLEYIHFTLNLKSKSRSTEQIKKYLDYFNIPDNFHNQLMKKYSLGMIRKLLLAICFLARPKMIILDEPSIGLDAPSLILLKKLVIEFAKKYKTSFLICAHEPGFFENLCTSLLILHDGKQKFYESPWVTGRGDLGNHYMDWIDANPKNRLHALDL